MSWYWTTPGLLVLERQTHAGYWYWVSAAANCAPPEAWPAEPPVAAAPRSFTVPETPAIADPTPPSPAKIIKPATAATVAATIRLLLTGRDRPNRLSASPRNSGRGSGHRPPRRLSISTPLGRRAVFRGSTSVAPGFLRRLAQSSSHRSSSR